MIPNLFSKAKIPKSLPKDMQDAVNEIKGSQSKKDCLRKAYDVLSEKYAGCHICTRFFDLFVTDLDKLWNKDGAAHCTTLDYLLRVLLVKSGFFKDENIELKLILIYIFPHQYLKIKLSEDKFINVDPWGAKHKIKFGDYASTFNYRI